MSVQLKAFALSPSGERLENPSTIEIVVLDQNDNRPAFTQKEFSGTVPEFSVPGTSMYYMYHILLQIYTKIHNSYQLMLLIISDRHLGDVSDRH